MFVFSLLCYCVSPVLLCPLTIGNLVWRYYVAPLFLPSTVYRSQCWPKRHRSFPVCVWEHASCVPCNLYTLKLIVDPILLKAFVKFVLFDLSVQWLVLPISFVIIFLALFLLIYLICIASWLLNHVWSAPSGCWPSTCRWRHSIIRGHYVLAKICK